MKGISITILLLGLFAADHAFAENVYRWIDDEGITRYGRTLPPEYADRPYEILSSSGVVIERIDPSALPAVEPAEAEKERDEIEPLFTEQEVRVRSDNLLMLRYHTEDDLLAAIENEVAQLGYDARLIHQTQNSAMTTLRAQIKNAADRQRAGLEEDEELNRKIRDLRQRLRRSERSLDVLEKREAAIRATFEKDLERYRYLAAGGAPGSIDPAARDEPEAN